MSRIDAKVATQMADVVRPVDRERQARLQVEQADRRTLLQTEAPSLAAKEPDADTLRAAVQQMQVVVEAASGRQLQFDTDERNEEILVQVKDVTTGEVITQIPSKKMLELRDRIAQMVGLILDQQA